MTVELGLLRHAHAGDPAAWEGPDDLRPLTDKGREQAERLGRFLAAAGFVPDAVLTSPRVRARETAELVADRLGVPVRIDPRLGSFLDLATVEAILDDAGRPARPVLVGHDPDFSDLLVQLTGSPGLRLRKGAFALLDVERPLTPGSAELHWLVPPGLLRR
jgi:phosphohistidine phosphatase SixA